MSSTFILHLPKYKHRQNTVLSSAENHWPEWNSPWENFLNGTNFQCSDGAMNGDDNGFELHQQAMVRLTMVGKPTNTVINDLDFNNILTSICSAYAQSALLSTLSDQQFKTNMIDKTYDSLLKELGSKRFSKFSMFKVIYNTSARFCCKH